MDKDRIVGSAKEFAGRAEGAVGDLAGDAQTQASGKAREAAGTVQNLYGQAKDAVRDAGETAAATPRTPTTSRPRPCATVRRRLPRRCRTIRSVRC